MTYSDLLDDTVVSARAVHRLARHAYTEARLFALIESLKVDDTKHREARKRLWAATRKVDAEALDLLTSLLANLGRNGTPAPDASDEDSDRPFDGLSSDSDSDDASDDVSDAASRFAARRRLTIAARSASLHELSLAAHLLESSDGPAFDESDSSDSSDGSGSNDSSDESSDPVVSDEDGDDDSGDGSDEAARAAALGRLMTAARSRSVHDIDQASRLLALPEGSGSAESDSSD